MHTKGPSVHDTEWRAMDMGSEGWAVFAGPRMIASHLSKDKALLIKQAPAMLEALEKALVVLEDPLDVFPRSYISVMNACKEAIRKAKENNDETRK